MARPQIQREGSDDLRELYDRVALLELGGVLPPVVSALPTNAKDGQVIRFQSSGMATDGIEWLFVYREAGAVGKKWECIGGGWLASQFATNETFTADSTWRDAATLGPDVTVPLAGDYDYVMTADMSQNTVAASMRLGLAIGAGATPDGADFGQGYGPTGGASQAITKTRRLTALAANQLLRLRYWSNGGGGNLCNTQNRRLAVLPVRVG